MNILCDENVREALRNALEQDGHAVTTVRETLDEGYDDADVLAHAAENGRVVLTNDDDFIDMDDHAGVLYYGEQEVDPRTVVDAVSNIELVFDTLADRTLFVPDGWT
ncbi:hypothetical protein BRD04_07805 [Halobacteriales archaeon QS_9_67_17]|nr:MAG: hypothetical protein BRD04_07805 [Halobacteriales archaeon QS_9_67_17]